MPASSVGSDSDLWGGNRAPIFNDIEDERIVNSFSPHLKELAENATMRRGLPSHPNDTIYGRDYYEHYFHSIKFFQAAANLCAEQNIRLDPEVIEEWDRVKQVLIRMYERAHEVALEENSVTPTRKFPPILRGAVYAIQCVETNQVYIGETQDEEKRRKQHFAGEFSTTRILTRGPYRDSLEWIVLHQENDHTRRLQLEDAQRGNYRQAGWNVINNEDIRLTAKNKSDESFRLREFISSSRF
jgi:predicted GIY-YIG superfamily endonuclease